MLADAYYAMLRTLPHVVCNWNLVYLRVLSPPHASRQFDQDSNSILHSFIVNVYPLGHRCMALLPVWDLSIFSVSLLVICQTTTYSFATTFRYRFYHLPLTTFRQLRHTTSDNQIPVLSSYPRKHIHYHLYSERSRFTYSQ